jgi:hypothetical protein
LLCAEHEGQEPVYRLADGSRWTALGDRRQCRYHVLIAHVADHLLDLVEETKFPSLVRKTGEGRGGCDTESVLYRVRRLS